MLQLKNVKRVTEVRSAERETRTKEHRISQEDRDQAVPNQIRIPWYGRVGKGRESLELNRAAVYPVSCATTGVDRGPLSPPPPPPTLQCQFLGTAKIRIVCARVDSVTQATRGCGPQTGALAVPDRVGQCHYFTRKGCDHGLLVYCVHSKLVRVRVG